MNSEFKWVCVWFACLHEWDVVCACEWLLYLFACVFKIGFYVCKICVNTRARSECMHLRTSCMICRSRWLCISNKVHEPTIGYEQSVLLVTLLWRQDARTYTKMLWQFRHTCRDASCVLAFFMALANSLFCGAVWTCTFHDAHAWSCTRFGQQNTSYLVQVAPLPIVSFGVARILRRHLKKVALHGCIGRVAVAISRCLNFEHYMLEFAVLVPV